MSPGSAARLGWAVAIAVATLGCKPQPPTQPAGEPTQNNAIAPFRLAFRYGRDAGGIDEEGQERLGRLAVDTFFLCAGTFTAGKETKLKESRDWRESLSGFKTYLLFDFDADFERKLAARAVDKIAPAVAKAVQGAYSEASETGSDRKGVQFDLSGPPTLIPAYVELLRRLRGTLDKRAGGLSAMVPPSWLTEPRMKDLAAEVDFIVLKLFDKDPPKNLADFQPAAMPAQLGEWLNQAQQLGVPFWVGLSSAGRAATFDKGGKLSETDHDLDVPDVWGNGSFAVERRERLGERAAPREPLAVLRYQVRDKDGRPRTWRLAYTTPSPALLKAELEAVKRLRSANCQGVVLFRYPRGRSDDWYPCNPQSMVLTLAEVEAAVKGESPKFEVRVEPKVAVHAWGVIDAGRRLARQALTVEMTVSNIGVPHALPGGEALTVTVTLDHPGVAWFEAGDFARAETGVIGPNGVFKPTPKERASAIRFVRHGFAPGDAA
jgi:hypothetical protein